MQQLDLTQCSNFLDVFTKNDLVGRLKAKGGVAANLLLLHDGQYELPIRASHQTDTPWVHVKQDPHRNCMLYHTIIFQCFDFIPEPCLECWKVVVRPRTVLELFKLYNLQVGLDEYSKCGIERERPFVNALYGGYFYNDSYEQGMERKAQVRKAVDEQISPEVGVILKRYCSEFELKFGCSKDYERPEDADHWEALVNKHCQGLDFGESRQPEILVFHVMHDWLMFAYKNQDPTAKLFNDGNPFYTKPYEYTKEDKEWLKRKDSCA